MLKVTKLFCLAIIFVQCESQGFLSPVINAFNRFTGGGLTNNNQYGRLSTSYVQQPDTFQQRSSFASSCEGIWSYAQDGSGNYGLIKISNPDRFLNELQVTMTIDATLRSVSLCSSEQTYES